MGKIVEIITNGINNYSENVFKVKFKKSGEKMCPLSAQCVNTVSKHGKCRIFIHQCNIRDDSVRFQKNVPITAFGLAFMYQS